MYVDAFFFCSCSFRLKLRSFAASEMGLPPDSASLIMLEIGRELQFYEDTLALVGLLYAGKLAISFSLSLYRGFKEHIFTKLYPNKEIVLSFGSWAGGFSSSPRVMCIFISFYYSTITECILCFSCDWSHGRRRQSFRRRISQTWFEYRVTRWRFAKVERSFC